MQDQISNRIQMLMNEQHEKIKQVVDDIATLVVVVLARGVAW